MMWGMARPRSWEAWSRAAWRRHLPDVADPDAFVAAIGHGTIHGLAHATAHATPDRPAIRIGGGEVTHGQLDSRAARFARWVGNRIAPGDRVLIAAPLGVDWVACYLGTLRVGGVAVLVNPAYTRAELDQLVVAAQPVEILTQLDESMFAAEPAPWVESAGPDTTAVLAFTSGTTGLPKGVPLTHRQLLTSIRSAMSAWRWRARDVLVHALPLFHQHGLGGVHATLIAGSRLSCLTRFDPEALLAEVVRAKATVLFAVPTMYQRLPDTPYELNRLRLSVSGSAALGRAAAERAEHVLGRAPLVRYGATESGLDTSHVYTDLRDPDRARTIGLPLPGIELRLAAGDGEIQLRGPQVFGGYWGDGASNQSAFTEDGWFRTGDIGRVDDSTGEVIIEGRSKEVIITGGLNVYPREVEIALESHPGVAEAVVAPLASEEWGEQVTAWVVMAPGATFDERVLINHSRTLLAAYKCPKRVFEMDTLPRNHVGKIDRRKLQPIP